MTGRNSWLRLFLLLVLSLSLLASAVLTAERTDRAPSVSPTVAVVVWAVSIVGVLGYYGLGELAARRRRANAESRGARGWMFDAALAPSDFSKLANAESPPGSMRFAVFSDDGSLDFWADDAEASSGELELSLLVDAFRVGDQLTVTLQDPPGDEDEGVTLEVLGPWGGFFPVSAKRMRDLADFIVSD